jgi:hypothetical protein
MKAAFSIIRSIWRDLYFVNTHAVWTGDPTYKVVQLRNRIVDLVESRIAEELRIRRSSMYWLQETIAMLWRGCVTGR